MSIFKMTKQQQFILYDLFLILCLDYDIYNESSKLDEIRLADKDFT